MLRNLKITNFQSHKLSELEFDPGVNIIVGSSDCGKTAIIRALRWVTWNRPGGDAFRSTWGGSTEVSIELDTGAVIVRRKDKENEYQFNDMLLQAFGTDVPANIKENLNINEINIQQQLDTPFLLDESSGSVAEFFNRIANLDHIDKGVSNISKWIRSIEQDAKYKTEDVKANQLKLEEFKDLDKFEAEVEVLEDIEKSKIVLANSIGSLKTLISNIVSLNEDIEEAGKLLKFENDVNNINDLISQKNKINIEVKQLAAKIYDLKLLTKEIKGKQSLLEMESDVRAIFDLKEQYESLHEEKTDLNILWNDIIAIMKDQEESEEHLSELQKIFKEEMPDVCPLCGTKLN
jgi:chromosome segregation ATPase